MHARPLQLLGLLSILCACSARQQPARSMLGDAGASGDASVATHDAADAIDGAAAHDASSVRPEGGGVTLMPVRAIPGLETIDFWEATSGVNRYTFAAGGPELNEHVTAALDSSNADINGAPTEHYDVYYSDADGTFNADGAYLTISGVFGVGAPAGGGLNLAEIQLNTPGREPEFGVVIGSSVALGDNKIPEDVGKCIDGDLNTATTMGNTVGTDERLRITLGFPSTVILL